MRKLELDVEALAVETLDVDFGQSTYASIIWNTIGEPVTDDCSSPTICCA